MEKEKEEVKAEIAPKATEKPKGESGDEEKKPKTLLQKILDVIATVIVVVVVIIAVFVLIITITSKRSPDGATDIFGYQMRTILTGSMEKCKHDDPTEECDHVDVSKYPIGHLPVNTMIFIELVPSDKASAEKWYDGIREGDVLTFQYEGIGVVTHRVIHKDPTGTGGYKIQLMGDNRGSDGTAGIQVIYTDSNSKGNYVIGKVVGQSEFLGGVVYTIKQPWGALLIIFIPCFVIVVIEVIKIISILVQSKKEKEQEKQEALNAESEAVRKEIEELKKQLALVQQTSDAPQEAVQDDKDASDKTES